MWSDFETLRIETHFVERYWNNFLLYIDHMQPSDWILVLAGVIVVGFVFLKSMGCAIALLIPVFC